MTIFFALDIITTLLPTLPPPFSLLISNLFVREEAKYILINIYRITNSFLYCCHSKRIKKKKSEQNSRLKKPSQRLHLLSVYIYYSFSQYMAHTSAALGPLLVHVGCLKVQEKEQTYMYVFAKESFGAFKCEHVSRATQSHWEWIAIGITALCSPPPPNRRAPRHLPKRRHRCSKN